MNRLLRDSTCKLVLRPGLSGSVIRQIGEGITEKSRRGRKGRERTTFVKLGDYGVPKLILFVERMDG